MTLRAVINSTKQEVDDKEREKYEEERRAAAERKALLHLDAKRKREESIGSRAEWIKKKATVLVKSDEENGTPYVAKLLDIHPDQHDRARDMATVMWFYRPEDTEGANTEHWAGRGKLPFHGEMELFYSDHIDTTPLDSITETCEVIKLRDYDEQVGWEASANGRSRAKYNDKGEQVFYHRFEYSAKRSKFKEVRVQLYCRCCQPYNPDKFMVQCDKCEHWLHMECLSKTERDDAEGKARVTGHKFVCADCARNAALRAPGAT